MPSPDEKGSTMHLLVHGHRPPLPLNKTKKTQVVQSSSSPKHNGNGFCLFAPSFYTCLQLLLLATPRFILCAVNYFVHKTASSARNNPRHATLHACGFWKKYTLYTPSSFHSTTSTLSAPTYGWARNIQLTTSRPLAKAQDHTLPAQSQKVPPLQ